MPGRSHFSRLTRSRVLIAFIFIFASGAVISQSNVLSFTSPLENLGKATRPASRPNQDPATCSTCAPPKQQVIYAPLIDLPDAASTEIVLNCRSAHEMEITPTFYTIEGKAVAGDPIHLQPAEMRFVETTSLIPARERNRHRWGGMSLSYVGNLLEAWAQMTLKGLRGGGSANVFFAVVNQPRANSIESVWWMPQNAEAVIALGNSSSETVHGNLIFGNGESQSVDIRPFATEIVRSRTRGLSLSSSDRSRAESVSINYTGPAGSLIPSGYFGSAQEKFTSTIRFYNPPNVVQPNLYANNLRLRNSTPHMLLKNTSTAFVKARPKFLDAGGVTVVELSPQLLAPSEVVEVDLRPVIAVARNRSDLDSVSVQVGNEGAPGSLIGALYSRNEKTGVAYDVPLRDSGSPRSSTGGYPVRLDGDYTTVLSISNAAGKAGDLTLQINYEGGPYQFGLINLKPGATKTVDIRKLRDEQTPDGNGHTLPRDLTTAQIRWSIRGNGTIPLSGRAEVVSLRDGVSSSYSCPTCCPHSFYDGWLDPGYFSIFIDDFKTVGSKQRQRDCYGNIYGPYDAGWGTWYAANPDIAAGDGNGGVTGISPGTAGFSFTYPVYYWMMDFDETCFPFESTDTENSSAEVPSSEVVLGTAKLYELTAAFVGVSSTTQIATLNAGSSSHANDICGDDPQLFNITVTFTLPPGGELVTSRCSAVALSIPLNNYNVGTTTCVMDAGLEGHMTIAARRRCCGGPDDHPGIRFVIGANKSGQSGTIDTPGTVRILCSQ